MLLKFAQKVNKTTSGTWTEPTVSVAANTQLHNNRLLCPRLRFSRFTGSLEQTVPVPPWFGPVQEVLFCGSLEAGTSNPSEQWRAFLSRGTCWTSARINCFCCKCSVAGPEKHKVFHIFTSLNNLKIKNLFVVGTKKGNFSYSHFFVDLN